MTSHIAKDRNILLNYASTPGHKIIGVEGVDRLGRGTIKLNSTVKGNNVEVTLKNVIHAPDAPHNLISVLCALESNMAVLFKEGEVKFKAHS